MAKLTAIEAANCSDTGRKRHHNEDSAVTALELGLAVVADGMGGYKAGEVASAIAAYRVLEEVRGHLGDRNLDELDGDSGYSRASLLVRAAIQKANLEIFTKAQQIEQCSGMGTTVVAVLFYGDRVTIAHVGDSRVYRFRNEELTQVTSDHSLVQELIDRGFFTPEEAAESTPRNLVTRALGIEENVLVDISQESVREGDVYLLCSDGLNDMVNDEEIFLTLSKYSANLGEAARALVDLANENGGKDNVSVVLAKPILANGSGSGLLSGLRNRIPGRSSGNGR